MALPILVINPPPVRPIPYGRLLDAISPIVPHAPINGDRALEERWLANGVTWTPEPCRALYTSDVDVCNYVGANTHLRADIPQCETAITQTSFSVWDAFKASVLEYTPEDVQAIIDGRLNIKTSAAFASELISGTISGDKALSKSATAPSGLAFGSSAPLYKTLPILENEFAARTRGAQGIVHMAPGMLQQAVFQCEVELGADGIYRTPIGNIVVADAGYVNMAAPTGNAAATPGTNDWVYISGMVQYGITKPVYQDGGDVGSMIQVGPGVNLPAGATFTTNDRIIRYADVYGILVFDPCPVTAALTTYAENA